MNPTENLLHQDCQCYKMFSTVNKISVLNWGNSHWNSREKSFPLKYHSADNIFLNAVLSCCIFILKNCLGHSLENKNLCCSGISLSLLSFTHLKVTMHALWNHNYLSFSGNHDVTNGGLGWLQGKGKQQELMNLEATTDCKVSCKETSRRE